jgi:aromatic ring hydroxylase
VTFLRRGICTVLDPCRDIPMNDVRAHLSCLEYIPRNTKDHHVHLQYLDRLLIHNAEMRIKTVNLIWKVTICEIGGVRAETEKKKRETEQRNELILIAAWES